MELQVVVMLIAVQTDNSFFALSAPLSDPPGHPTTRPFGFAALLDSLGAHLAGRSQTRFAQTVQAPFPQ